MEFVREKIKEKPLDRKSVAIKVGVAMLCGIAFAISACTVCVLVWETLDLSVIKENEQETETQQLLEIAQEIETQQMNEQMDTELETEQVITSDVSVSLTDYQNLQNELYALGNQVSKSIVTVTSIVDENEMFYDTYQTSAQGTGVIIFEDEYKFYVLTETSCISDAEYIQVTLADGTSTKASVWKQDKNMEIIVLTISKNKLTNETLQEIKVAKIGNSNGMAQGEIVIALGNLLGITDSILTGNIISTSHEMMTLDNNYKMLTTNIVTNQKGNGVLVNTKGEIVAIAIQKISSFYGGNTLMAIGISEISNMIQGLLAQKELPYIGLYISTITNHISDTYNIPKGVFVKEIATDSPAMRAGLQSGDVIVRINGEKVENDTYYSTVINQLDVGSICEMLIKRQSGEEYYNVVCQVEVGTLQ
ncbi:MAG: trypsin-like peptidase domain-containing protein [Lachnospiraceae bacterium]|nr:trypsin-like peptidase domain-containing protein [Lachnospiraceae bacterium]